MHQQSLRLEAWRLHDRKLKLAERAWQDALQSGHAENETAARAELVLKRRIAHESLKAAMESNAVPDSLYPNTAPPIDPGKDQACGTGASA